MNESDFMKEIKILFSNYSKQPTNDMLSAWYELLKDHDYRLLKKAVIKIMAEKRYMPTIKEILDTIQSLPYEYYTEEEKINQWEKEGIKPSCLKELK